MSEKQYYSTQCGWKNTTSGGIILHSGNAKEFKTGDWRSQKPIWSEDKCKHCMLCWTVCPDMSINVSEKKMTGIDYDHCKGCGLCVNQCKFKALEMITEE